MTGKEAIIHYLGTHKSFCAQDVSALTGSCFTGSGIVSPQLIRAVIQVSSSAALRRNSASVSALARMFWYRLVTSQ